MSERTQQKGERERLFWELSKLKTIATRSCEEKLKLQDQLATFQKEIEVLKKQVTDHQNVADKMECEWAESRNFKHQMDISLQEMDTLNERMEIEMSAHQNVADKMECEWAESRNFKHQMDICLEEMDTINEKMEVEYQPTRNIKQSGKPKAEMNNFEIQIGLLSEKARHSRQGKKKETLGHQNSIGSDLRQDQYPH